ncbi:MAG: glycosyltransferase family 61 protein [Bacteroidota bacterium]
MKPIYKKIKRKLTQLLVRVVVYNKHYKPIGFYRTAQEYSQSAEGMGARWMEIYPSYVSKQVVPRELNESCLSYYKSEEESLIPATIVAEVLHGREYQDVLFGGTIISQTNKIIGDISYYQPNPDNQRREPVEKNNLFKQKFFQKPKYFPGVVFSCVIGFNGSDNYYHWMFDCLTKLHLLQASGLYSTVDWFLMPEPKEEYHRSMLDLLGIPPEKIIFEHECVHIQADKIIATVTERHYNHTAPWMFSFLRKSFLRPDIVRGTGDDFIYISRSDSHRRNVANEAELMGMLSTYGFKMLTLTPLSFVEKMSVFASAKIIIAPHGAGLANLTFCTPGATLIELFTETYVCACYSEMALKVGMDYHYLVFDYVDSNQPEKSVDHHIHAEVDKVKQVLDISLSSFAVLTS